MMRMGREARVNRALYSFMPGQEVGDHLRVAIGLLHAHGQRLGAAQNQPRIHRPQDRTRRVLHELQPVDIILVLENDDAADAIAVAVEELGGAVQHDVGADRQRPLKVRAREGVVDNHPDVLRVGNLADRGDVGDLQHRVGRRLDEQVLGVGLDRRPDQLGFGGVDVREVETELAAHPLEQPEGAAIRVVAHQHVIARLEPGQHRVDGRHARGKGKRRGPGFDGRDVSLQRHARRVLGAAILEPGVRLAEAILHIGGGLVNRRDDRAGGRVRFLTGMNANSAEASGVGQFHWNESSG